MSNLVDLFNKSQGTRVKEARTIPFTPKNFVDVLHKFLSKFQIFDKPGDPTEYTSTALKYYDTELKDLTRPAGFDPNTPLNQWNPNRPYEIPGEPKS